MKEMHAKGMSHPKEDTIHLPALNNIPQNIRKKLQNNMRNQCPQL